ncbi:Dol-P-Glc:Glc(2)Man(9)GlcNAc(2)-PP-Dol alpha-1,2-glucosyltransferase [Collichthys lucidus]|uniref:Dol-P-Glc:Glc(2)Man(9)GlcNAc(2)-PP-Dol alpha-1,2-glucosyltransferase n=1 Tax=Collichthys lucidus TaxID=240159 RepID=A0A4U5VQU4_COLLU|nr:Dol-P-Glc:Glc(2)Man(9)GlcNAc(2)-PP-Dol alpha-1,2-glucosyltransferase [Collichthys lucidus]
MEKFEGYVFTALCSTNFLISCLLFSRVTREQREPYMDEVFHIPQAQKYCQGKFNEWDPMITTLPGLYLVSVGVIKPVVWLADLTGAVVCSTAMLRFINLLFNCGNLYLLYLLICKLHLREKTRTTSRRVLSALSLSTFPVLYFFNFLYYTDAGSTFFILFTYLMTLYGCHKASAFLGACSVLFRQTNIIWVAFCAGTLVAAKMDETWRVEHMKKRDEKSPPSQVPLSFSGAKKVILFTLEFVTSPSHVKAVLLVAWPYAVVGVGFLVFVVLNDGIVAGYLLADNRHFPFYVWKRLFQRHEMVRFLLVPAYVFAGWNFLDSFKSRSLFWSLAFLACLLAATVPQKLLEFRRSMLPQLYIFISKTFHWPDSTAAQRFMW